MKLVLIEKNIYRVYEGRVLLETFVTDATMPKPTPEEIEYIRTAEYKSKA